jgi:trehalose 6-phosphate synthase/phosphatase
MNPGLVIVSNRLPVSVKKVDGKLEFFPSIGGLAMGLASYATNRRNKWIGWPGLPSDDLTDKEKQLISEELLKHNCYPVFLTQKQIDGFYNGYSNRLIWPLFHDVILSRSAVAKEEEYWKAYRQVNKLYAESVLARSDTGNNIWVHDYQLMLLPALLRAERPKDKIGFFLHIPFPEATRLNQLKEGSALLAGILGSDLVGFHIVPYANNFLNSVKEYDIAVTEPRKVILDNRVVRVTDFPIGIDYAKWRKANKLWAVRKEYIRLKLKYWGKKIIITVDRLDPSKGLVERLTAYETLLKENPELRKKVQLVMIAVPSRTDIEEYRKLKENLEKLVAKINKDFGTNSWQPVDYQYVSLGFEQLSALYQRANIAFIAPLRDGMNLVAKEYLASRPHHSGVLVLSETAGAAAELKDSIMVDPLKPISLVNGLKRAVTMPRRKFKKQVALMQKTIAHATIQTWAGGFVRSLRQSNAIGKGYTSSLSAITQKQIVSDYNQAFKRLLLVDYDGVLAAYANRPEDALPTPRIKEILSSLAAEPDNIVVVISGRDKANLDQWLSNLNLSLVAEHGIFTKKTTDKDWHVTPNTATKDWQRIILPVLEKYASKTPGAFVETKIEALVWHYRKGNAYHAHKYLVILKRVLKPLAKKYHLQVNQGNKILEIRPVGIDKGTSAAAWIRDTNPDFVLALGDDYTDEDMFASLPASAYTLKVGRGNTKASYRLKNPTAVLNFLEELTKIDIS